MKLGLSFVLCALFALSAQAADEFDDKDVIHVTIDNYMDFITSGKNGKGVFLQFAAPWCGFCKRLKPGWAQLATEVKDRYPVGLVNTDAQPELKAIYEIYSFPTVTYIENGKVYVYDGERVLDDFIAFAELSPADRTAKAKDVLDAKQFPQTEVTFAGTDDVEEAETNAEIDELIAGSGSRTPILVLGVTGRSDTERALPLFKKISATHEETHLVIYVNIKNAEREVAGRFYLGAKIIDTRAGLVKNGKVHWFAPTLREKEVMADIARGTTDNVVDLPSPRSAWLIYKERLEAVRDMLIVDAYTMYEYKKGILALVSAIAYFSGVITTVIVSRYCCCKGGACGDSKRSSKGNKSD